VIHGRGGKVGPDLSNLVHRDYASVLRDITNPSFAINPDYLSYAVVLTDGRVLSGVVQTADGGVLVGDQEGKITRLDPSNVEEMRPTSVSAMPEGTTKPLSDDRMRDLMTFLLTAPPETPSERSGRSDEPAQ
jgi:putative heme-binding domain-containing protein